MTGEEFGLWAAAFHESPWDETRADLRAGIVAATLANCHRSGSTAPYKPIDFMPYAPKHEPAGPQTPDDFVKMLEK